MKIIAWFTAAQALSQDDLLATDGTKVGAGEASSYFKYFRYQQWRPVTGDAEHFPPCLGATRERIRLHQLSEYHLATPLKQSTP